MCQTGAEIASGKTSTQSILFPPKLYVALLLQTCIVQQLLYAHKATPLQNIMLDFLHCILAQFIKSSGKLDTKAFCNAGWLELNTISTRTR